MGVDLWDGWGSWGEGERRRYRENGGEEEGGLEI